ncbi:MAG TPA: NAD(P)-dependent oxidoreductase [Gemmatimonadaceae bacterium]|nr:NAD(P)-dependent oxidoreductase [Gemmatimonadaceae bacterium]
MTLWVTGAKGFIGRNLARHLAAQDGAVLGVGHGLWPETEARDWGVSHWINGEIDASTLQSLKAVGGVPTRVFHVAGGSSVGASIANPLEDFNRTVTTTARLLDWLCANAPDASLIVLSSAAVYGSDFRQAIDEDAEPNPASPYGFHKLMMEDLCRSYAENFGLRCTAIRLFSVYGPGLRKQLLWDLCTRLSENPERLTLSGTGNELRDWTEISDVVRLIEAAALADCPGFVALNGGSGIPTSVSSIARHVLDAWGSAASVTFDGAARRGDPHSMVAGDGFAKRQRFDWRIPIDEGIPRYVAWFKDMHK